MSNISRVIYGAAAVVFVMLSLFPASPGDKFLRLGLTFLGCYLILEAARSPRKGG